MHLRPELVSGEHVECEGRELPGNDAGPKVPVGSDGGKRVNDNPSEVDVADHHNVVLPEERELHQIHRSLPVRARRLAQVLNRPDDREEHGAAADDVDEEEDLLPRVPVLVVGPALVDRHLRKVGDDLERDDDHEHLLLLVLQVGFEERPAGPDEDDQGEERDTLQEAEDVEENVPAVSRSGALDEGLVLGLAEEV